MKTNVRNVAQVDFTIPSHLYFIHDHALMLKSVNKSFHPNFIGKKSLRDTFPKQRSLKKFNEDTSFKLCDQKITKKFSPIPRH